MTASENIDDLKERLSGLAEQVARDSYRKKLDYSIRSVREVEKMLADIHDSYKKTHDDEGLNGLAFAFAAYIIKVIEKNYQKGEWTTNHPIIGEGTFPYEWEGQTIFPVAWCQKRIFDGPGDDVWAKFQVLVAKENQ